MKWILAGVLVVLLFIRDMLSGVSESHADDTGRRNSWYGLSIVALVVIACLASGCASFQAAGRELLPVMEAQPIEQATSNYAEGTFLVLDGIDTLQTIQIAKHPNCWREADPFAAKIYGTDHPKVGVVIGVNIALMLAHTMVAAWLDDEVAAHDKANDGSVGPWYVGRVAFHTVSILASGAAVANNYHLGIKPLGGGC